MVPDRKSLRLQHYDYTQSGAYFLTLCTKERMPVLSDPACSNIIHAIWRSLPERYTEVALDAYILMADHMHGILWLTGKETSLPRVIQAFKSLTMRAWRIHCKEHGIDSFKSFWQYNYYEHVLRNEKEVARVRAYIENNPAARAIQREERGER